MRAKIKGKSQAANTYNHVTGRVIPTIIVLNELLQF